MAEKHPYTSGSGGLIQTVNQLRNTFPNQISADTLKKLGIAPNNETYVINILRFIGIINADGQKTEKAASAFSKHDDSEFRNELSSLIEAAYSNLFGLYSQNTWNLTTDKLISFFRNADHTSAIVGQRQATTFQTLARLSGHLDSSVSKSNADPKSTAKKPAVTATTGSKPKKMTSIGGTVPLDTGNGKGVGLTVRIEINLPTAPDQETYDRIFRSIKENLLNG